MAFRAKICVQLSDDCTTAYFFDTTGVYNAITNPTGYGTPNPEVSDFTTATLTLLLAGATVAEAPIDIFGSPAFPTDDSTIAWQVNASDYGLTTFTTGLTRFTYRIDNTGSGDTAIAYNATTLVLSACEYECCVKQKQLAIIKDPKACSCDDDRIEDLFFAQFQLEAAQLSTGCGDVASANTALENLSKICGECGCGC